MPRASTSPITAEKRSAQRIPVRLRARYFSEMVNLDGWVANLSRCGLFLHTDLLDSEGVTATVELRLPGVAKPVRVMGEVVRVDLEPGSSGMGIRFHGLSRAELRLLANFMIERSIQAPADA